MFHKFTLKIILSGFFCILSLPVFGAKTVLIGLYHFPPFIEAKGSEVKGLAVELIKIMNKQQTEYYFKGIRTLPNTRIDTFDKGRYDLSMFENIKWGWKGHGVDLSDVFLTGGEVYLSLKKQGRDQSFFNDFTNKKMVGIKGYHYAFANYNADVDYLSTTFNMSLTSSNLRSIMALDGAGDIAVVSKAFLLKYLHDNPEKSNKYLISDHYDQAYQHRIVVRQGIRPSVEEINLILKALIENGEFEKLLKTLDPTRSYFKADMIPR